MHVVCLDLEGVLVPEIWIAFAEATGILELKRTTRDEPDYNKLMAWRLEILKREGLKLSDIQRVIATMDPLEGAKDFVKSVKKETQLIILSDTFLQFANPLMEKLDFPTLFCNSLKIAEDGTIVGWRLRQEDGKRRAVEALQSINLKVFAAGDSYNDLSMLASAEDAALFHAPESIVESHPQFEALNTYAELFLRIERFLLEV